MVRSTGEYAGVTGGQISEAVGGGHLGVLMIFEMGDVQLKLLKNRLEMVC